MRRFVGDASHELRTPLVSVRGYAELYRMGALQSRDEVAQAMDRIEKEAIRMGGLVEDLLALARLDEAKPLGWPRSTSCRSPATPRSTPWRRTRAHRHRHRSRGAQRGGCREPGARARGRARGRPPRHRRDLVRGAPSPDCADDARAAGDTALGRRGGQRAGVAASGSSAAGRQARTTTADGVSARAVAPADPDDRARSAPATTTTLTAPVRRAVVLAEENKIRQVITNLMATRSGFTSDDSPIDIRVSIDAPPSGR